MQYIKEFMESLQSSYKLIFDTCPLVPWQFVGIKKWRASDHVLKCTCRHATETHAREHMRRLRSEFSSLAFLWGEPLRDPGVAALVDWKDELLYGPVGSGPHQMPFPPPGPPLHMSMQQLPHQLPFPAAPPLHVSQRTVV
jgi:hypothetical protein